MVNKPNSIFQQNFYHKRNLDASLGRRNDARTSVVHLWKKNFLETMLPVSRHETVEIYTHLKKEILANNVNVDICVIQPGHCVPRVAVRILCFNIT